ncbi:signal transduction histidine kinase [Asanoa ferruginea]|uniref:histidine kinase n=1 Tax=Asanoa ferruginea TaxID=53367 RepID=A0A3D9ZIA7_9ACTN|nr:sensor histidine kinase [Asanoa ferruginea]REF95613.1 signal transduction histidine kinase [Asanoa ferruginea]GIF51975.1 histidine kinase [Asanoa ferruginea]
MTPRTAFQAVSESPLGFLASSWPWRSVAYLISGVLLGALTAGVLIGLLLAGALLAVALVGLVAFLAVALSGVAVGRFERWRLRLIDPDPLPDPHRRPERAGRVAWVRTRLREPATWRELGYTVVSLGALWWIDALMLGLVLGIPISLMVTPLFELQDQSNAFFPKILYTVAGLALLPFAAYPVTVWAAARGALARAILAPRDAELGAQLVEVSRSRARLVDAFDVERRRIERDLHDGAQQRLVALSMAIGLARLEVADGSTAAKHLTAAQDEAERAHAELRELIRGVHPQVLTDRGLPASVTDLADRSPVPVRVDVELPRRLPAPVEVTAHFVVSEALTNVARHSGASGATVHARLHVDTLVLEVRDDGAGGADLAGGTGLAGLADRVAAAGGRLLLSSPPGGPTLVRAELPCSG